MAKYVTVNMTREMHSALVRMADSNGLSVPGQIQTYIEAGLEADAAKAAGASPEAETATTAAPSPR